MTMMIIAAVVMTAGLFMAFRISLTDFSQGIFGGLLKGRDGIRDVILEETSAGHASRLKREIEEVRDILVNTGREKDFPLLCTASVLLFTCGGAFAAAFGNPFLIPVMAVGCAFIPFWYVRLTATHYKRHLTEELETALSVVTTAYLRSEDVLTSIEENVSYLNPPVRTDFEAFLSRVRLVDPDVTAALEELRVRIPNGVFEEWVDALKACQYDRSLKTTLVPIVAKLSDERIVNAELEYLLSQPRKEFITMAVLVVSNVPIMYFLNRDWFYALTGTLPGKFMMALCGVVIFVSAAFVIRLTKPIEYQG